MNNTLFVKLYNGIKNVSAYAKESSYYYEGFFECDKTVGYINLYNSQSKETQLEKLQISFNISWSKSLNITNFFIFALTPNSVPVVKKGVISTSKIENIEPYKNDLIITKEELNKIQYNNAWILENANYDHFFYDT